jgi:hypothetical protein
LYFNPFIFISQIPIDYTILKEISQLFFTVKKEKAREHGLNESKAGRFFKTQVEAQIEGKREDDFYLRVKEMLLSQGEVSDAIGRLTDRAYYDTLSYEEKQRYTLALSEKYLRALERFRAECEFECLG